MVWRRCGQNPILTVSFGENIVKEGFFVFAASNALICAILPKKTEGCRLRDELAPIKEVLS